MLSNDKLGEEIAQRLLALIEQQLDCPTLTDVQRNKLNTKWDELLDMCAIHGWNNGLS